MFFISNMIFLSLKTCFTVHSKWVVIVPSSLRLLLKVWIWYISQNRIEDYYHHNGEQLDFYKKVRINTQSKKKDFLVIFALQETMNSNLFDKSCTQENVKFHIQHEESWLRWIVIEQVSYKQHYFPLIFPERNCARILSKIFRRSNRDIFLENEGKIHEGGCVGEFFSLTFRLASRNFIID